VGGAVGLLQTRLRALARATPPADAMTFVVAHRICGSVAPAVAQCLVRSVAGFRVRNGALELADPNFDAAHITLRLEQAARKLLQAGFISAWRDEKLDLRPEADQPALAQIDRCAVRVLGITTYSVHLNGHTADGNLVVARRAAHKRVDPGLWDNLVGGMIAAGESVREALARETFEEAGLLLEDLPLQEGARIPVRRPIREGTLSELVHVFDVDLPAGTQPVNQDGEVERFEVRSVGEVLAGIERGEFTVEAALATLDSLERRGHH